MPVARVQSPDGRIGRFEVPEGWTPEQVEAFATKQFAAPPAQPAEFVDIPQPISPTEADPTIAHPGRNLQIGIQGAGRAGADIAGFIPDIATGLSNLGLAGIDMIPGVDLDYRFPPSPLGSDASAGAASDVAAKAGFGTIDESEMTPGERAYHSVNRFATEGLAGATGLTRMAAKRAGQTGAQAPRLSDAFVKPYMDGSMRPVVGDVAGGAAAGGALVGANDTLDALGLGQFKGPITDMIAMLLGGAAGSTAIGTGMMPKKVVNAVADSRPEFVDAQSLKPTSKRTVDRAAKVVQAPVRAGGGDPAEVAGKIAERQAATPLNEPMPTTGIATDDIGLNALERGFRIIDPIPFQARDQQLRDAAQERVTGLRDPDADPRAAQRFVERDVAQQRETAQAPVEAARRDLGETRDRGAQRLTEAEEARKAALAGRDDAVQTGKAAVRDATEAENTLGGEVQGRLGSEGAASERVAGTVAESKAVQEAQKAGLYREAEQLGKQTEVDAAGLAADAKAVRDEISSLAANDARLNNILDDLERLAPKDAKPTDTGVLDEAGRPITKAAEPKRVSVSDLIAIRPRLAQARDAASQMRRGGVVQRLDQINSGIKQRLDGLAEAGDAAALKWREAEANFRQNFAPRFREGVGNQLDKAERAGRPIPPTAVAGKLLKPGAGGKEAAEDLNRILDGAPNAQAGREAAYEYVLADMARVVGSDGRINPARLRTWIANRAGMFQAEGMTDLKAEAQQVLQDVVNRRNATAKLQTDLEKAVKDRRGTDVSTRKQVNAVKADNRLTEKQKQAQIAELERNAAQAERDIQKSATSLLLDADPAVAARDVFKHRDPSRAMAEIVEKLSGDADALAGWKRAVTEHLVERVTNTNTALTGTADGPVSVAKMQKFFDQHAEALSKVYSPAEMNSLRRAQKIMEPLGNLQRQATAGSATAENKALWSSVEAGLLAVTGNAITAGMVMKRIRSTRDVLHHNEILKDQGKLANQLVGKIFFDPELAKTLLTRDVKEIKSAGWNAKLNRLLAYGQLARESVDEQAGP